MKALSLRHPSIDLLILGARTVLARPNATSHRGPLLLHASATYGPAEREALAALRAQGLDLPDPEASTRGAFVATGELVECRRLAAEDAALALSAPRPSDQWAWVFAGVRRLAEPVAGHGHVFMWEPVEIVPIELAAAGR